MISSVLGELDEAIGCGRIKRGKYKVLIVQSSVFVLKVLDHVAYGYSLPRGQSPPHVQTHGEFNNRNLRLLQPVACKFKGNIIMLA